MAKTPGRPWEDSACSRNRRYWSRHCHREAGPSPDAGRMSPFRLVVVDLPVRPPGEHFLERDARLHPRKCRTEAEVDAVSERQMRGLPTDVKPVGVWKM